jgi:methionine-rich copper-binding protein CopC
MKTLTNLLFTALLIVLMIAAAPAVWAHSFPEQESPAAGETVAAPPANIAIKYDAPIESLFDSLRVLDAAGQDKAAGAPQVSADGHELSVPVTALDPGQYTVKWRVVCIDTHHTEGSYTFTVKSTNQ